MNHCQDYNREEVVFSLWDADKIISDLRNQVEALKSANAELQEVIRKAVKKMSCHGLEGVDMEPKLIKNRPKGIKSTHQSWWGDAKFTGNTYAIKKPLTQADIDHGPRPPISRRCSSWREALEYLNGYPGGILTTVVFLIIFAAVMWGLFAAAVKG